MQPKELTIVKVIQHSPLVRTVFARDEKGRIWKRLEGFEEQDWQLFKKASVL